MTLRFLSGSKNFCKLLWVSCEVLFSHGHDWIHWVVKVLHHDCTSMIVSRFTSFTENFVIFCIQVTKIFCTRYGSANSSSARCPCNFGPLTDLVISVFRELSTNTVFTQIHTSHWRRLWRWFMRRTGVWVSMFRNSVIHEIFSEILQPLGYVRTQRVSPF